MSWLSGIRSYSRSLSPGRKLRKEVGRLHGLANALVNRGAAAQPGLIVERGHADHQRVLVSLGHRITHVGWVGVVGARAAIVSDHAEGVKCFVQIRDLPESKGVKNRKRETAFIVRNARVPRGV